MSEYTKYPKVTPEGLLPPKVIERLDERFVNHSEWSQQVATQISVASYGAKPGTSTDQAPSFQSAIDAAATFGVSVVVPPGVYRMNRGLVLPSGCDLQMHPNAVLDYSSSSATNFLNINGSAGASVSAPAITAGTKTIALSGHGLVAGQWCYIRSNDVFDPHSTSTTHGELIQVSSVGTGTVTFRTSVCDNYTTGVKVTPVTTTRNVSISGGTIRGDGVAGSDKGGLRAWLAEDLWLDRVCFQRIDRAHTFMKDCINTWLMRCLFDYAESTSMGYGVAFNDSSRDSGAAFCTFRAVRHAFTTGNTVTAGVGGIVRRVLFFGNTVEDTTYATEGSQLGGDAIDTHTAAEDVWIVQNSINASSGAGVNVECASAVVSGNTVEDTVGSGINYHNESARPGRITITDNVVRRAGSHGIQARTGSRGTQVPTESMIIIGNQVSDSSRNGIQAGFVITDGGVVVTGNTVSRAGEVSLRLVKLDGAVAHGNVVYGGASIGIEYDQVTNAVLGPDSVDAGSPTGAWTGLSLKSVTYSKVTPGAVKVADPAGVGVTVESSCSNLALGPTSHLNATTKLVNNAGSTVVKY